MKDLVFKNKYTKGISTGILIMLSPVIFWALLWIPSLIYPDDCDIAARCEHAVVEIAMSLGFGLLFFGLPVLLLGAFIVLLSIFFYGIHTLRQRGTSNNSSKYTKVILGSVAGVILLFGLYIPSGPDECSRVFTDEQYTNCLMEIFNDKTEQETRLWLEANGYDVTRNLFVGEWSSLSREEFKHKYNKQHDFYAQAFRDHGRWKSIPYGTNFTRIVLPMFPAPSRFQLDLLGTEKPDRVYDVEADWSFSFL
jgi:hypothetical protein